MTGGRVKDEQTRNRKKQKQTEQNRNVQKHDRLAQKRAGTPKRLSKKCDYRYLFFCVSRTKAAILAKSSNPKDGLPLHVALRFELK